MEESLAENKKHQRAAKPVSCVNANTVKNASFTLNDLGSLSLLSNRADSLVISVPSEVRRTTRAFAHLRGNTGHQVTRTLVTR